VYYTGHTYAGVDDGYYGMKKEENKMCSNHKPISTHTYTNSHIYTQTLVHTRI
jgi:hypothetical protein